MATPLTEGCAHKASTTCLGLITESPENLVCKCKSMRIIFLPEYLVGCSSFYRFVCMFGLFSYATFLRPLAKSLFHSFSGQCNLRLVPPRSLLFPRLAKWFSFSLWQQNKHFGTFRRRVSLGKPLSMSNYFWSAQTHGTKEKEPT